MGIETKRTGVWNALAQTFGDEFFGVSGSLLVKATKPSPSVAVHEIGDTTVYLEGTHRFPTSGVFVVNGEIHYFTGSTVNTFTGVNNRLSHIADPADPDPPPTGLSVRIFERDVVLLLSSDHTLGTSSKPQTDFDHYRLTFLLETAEGKDLDVLAGNYGLARPRWFSDALFRQYLFIMIALDASTIHAMEKVLDVLVGSGNYKIWENEWLNHNEVFVDLVSQHKSSYRGKGFMGVNKQLDAATDIQVTSAGSPPVVTDFKLTLPDTPGTVYGVWEETDIYRTGINFCESRFGVQTHSANPTFLKPIATSSYPYVVFTPSDVGKGVSFLLRKESWVIEDFISPLIVVLGRHLQKGGSVSSGSPHQFRSSYDYFEPWMVGHTLAITDSTNIANLQHSTISNVINPNVIETANAVEYVTDVGGVSFKVIPNFSTRNSVCIINRVENVGPVVSLPVATAGGNDPPSAIASATAGAFMNVDYTTIPSFELCSSRLQSGNDQYAAYFWDEYEILRNILALITAAGVTATPIVVESL